MESSVDEYGVNVNELSPETKQRYEEYKTKIEESWAKCQLVLEATDWSSVDTKEGVSGFTRPSETGYKYIKGEGFVNAKPDIIAEYLKDASKKSEWDEMFNSGKDVEIFSKDFKIVYNLFNMPTLVTNREFIFISATKRFPDGTIAIVAAHVEHPNVPPTKNVRGQVINGLFLLKPKDNGSYVIYLQNTNPAGSLPTKVVNWASSKQAFNVLSIKKRFP